MSVDAPNESSVVEVMIPFKIGFCGDEVGVGEIACGRKFPCPLDDASNPSYASQRRYFGRSGVNICCRFEFVLFFLLRLWFVFVFCFAFGFNFGLVFD